MFSRCFILLLVWTLAGCQREAAVTLVPAVTPEPAAASAPAPALKLADWSMQVGQRVTLEGLATAMKDGAVLKLDDQSVIHIDGLHWWPHDSLEADLVRKRVRVTGIVGSRGDSFTLRNAKWTVLMNKMTRQAAARL